MNGKQENTPSARDPKPKGEGPFAHTLPKRPCGLANGEFIVPDDFNDPLSDLEDEIYECPALAGLPPAS